MCWMPTYVIFCQYALAEMLEVLIGAFVRKIIAVLDFYVTAGWLFGTINVNLFITSACTDDAFEHTYGLHMHACICKHTYTTLQSV